jgi:hypothetical protein
MNVQERIQGYPESTETVKVEYLVKTKTKTKTWGEVNAEFFPGGFCEGGEDELGAVIEHPCWMLENDFFIESNLISEYEYEDNLHEIEGFKFLKKELLVPLAW